jgi:hypothetical protein
MDVYKKVAGEFDFDYRLPNLADSCEHGNEPSGSIKCGGAIISFSLRTLLHGVGLVCLSNLSPTLQQAQIELHSFS